MANRKRSNGSRRQQPRAPWWRTWRVGVIGLVAVATLAVAGFIVRGGAGQNPTDDTPWATLGTADVHSLAFDPADAQHLYFGHHTGLLESRDGGRRWQPTALGSTDAMNVRVSSGRTLQVAGHNVYRETTDGGRTWTAVPNDLPGLDLHAFVIDPANPTHAWAYSVGFGLFESNDGGRHWLLRQTGEWPVMAVTRFSGTTTLISLSSSGMGASSDGGRTWLPLAAPVGQVASLAAAADGAAIFAGATNGLYRSLDAGKSWKPTGFTGLALTVAVAPSDPRTVALVDDSTRLFRSDDGGATWLGPP